MTRTLSGDAFRRALESAGLLRSVHGEIPNALTGVFDDSRQVTPGSAFVAVPGTGADGHAYIEQATQSGAALLVVERETGGALPAIVVADARRAAAVTAAELYGHPARALTMTGVTGTNGKTTTVNLARGVLDETVGPAASIGTLGVLVGREGSQLPGGGGLTTPGPVELQRVLRALADSGITVVAMEVSSHSLSQRRVEGVEFQAIAFTNFTRDHLDYHGTMEEYFAAKARLTEHLAVGGTLVVNADDVAWRRLSRPGRALTFGLGRSAQVAARSIEYQPRGSDWTLRFGSREERVRFPLVGEVNVMNALAAAALSLAVGADLPGVAAALSRAPQIPGRLEVLSESPLVLRDYAHTPDALERALETARRLATGQLIAVFGCGGERDTGKRPMMGEIAARIADYSIVTSDNPRGEDPESIIDQIVEAMPPGSYDRIEDRRAAIARALSRAGNGDVVLIAGKGHETYQIRGGDRLPFDESKIVNDLIGER